MGFFEKLGAGLKKTRDSVFGTISQMMDAGDVTPELYEDLEEQLILADTGADVAMALTQALRERVLLQRIKAGADALAALKDIIREKMTPESELSFTGSPAVILVIGVNGVGKTTSIGKLAHLYTNEGKTVMLAAADTFRAAAAEQLSIWAQRAKVPLVRHQHGADPAAVVFDAVASASAKNVDIVLCDTAGRLHNKKNLMDELEKIVRSVKKANKDAQIETLLVLDGATGQNAISQATEFVKAAGATGIILTKLDGTAKGGAVIAVKEKLGLPVRYVGVGEGIEDLMPFDERAFVDALFIKG